MIKGDKVMINYESEKMLFRAFSQSLKKIFSIQLVVLSVGFAFLILLHFLTK